MRLCRLVYYYLTHCQMRKCPSLLTVNKRRIYIYYNKKNSWWWIKYKILLLIVIKLFFSVIKSRRKKNSDGIKKKKKLSMIKIITGKKKILGGRDRELGEMCRVLQIIRIWLATRDLTRPTYMYYYLERSKYVCVCVYLSAAPLVVVY